MAWKRCWPLPLSSSERRVTPAAEGGCGGERPTALLTGSDYRKVEEGRVNTAARAAKRSVAKRKREGGRAVALS